MKKRTLLLIMALLLTVMTLSACQEGTRVWGREKLLVVSKAQGTDFLSDDGSFSLTAPDTFRDITDTDEKATMILTDGTLTLRVDQRKGILNLATTSEESTIASFKDLDITFVSYTRGLVLGANGIKAVGNYEEDGIAMQQCQYSLNQDKHCYVLTAYYPLDQARTLKSKIASILGSFKTYSE